MQSTAPGSPTRREIRVFVSSTFRDMQAERNELTKFVFPKLRKRCQERGVTWTSVDLRWGIPEEDANRLGVLSICLDEIQHCRPYFIGMLGERYGWVPRQGDRQLLETEPWLSDLEDRSITELEILHGVLNDPAMAEHSFFYFRDPAYLETLPPDQRQQYREQPGSDSARRLLDLKARIRASQPNLVENYADPRSLSEHVEQDLGHLIDTLFPVGTEPNALERERLEQAAFADSRTKAYVDRPEAMERLDQYVAGGGPPLTVLGASGTGKTALLANWARRHRERHTDEFTFLHLIGSTGASVDWAAMLRRCMGELQIHLDLHEPIAEDYDDLRVQFANWLSIAASTSRVVLVIDALDQLEDRQGAPDLIWLPETLPQNARVLLSTLPGRSLGAIQKRGWPAYELTPLTIQERRQLTEAYLSLFRKRLSQRHLQQITQASQSANPLFLKTLLNELRLFGEHERLGQRIDEYLEASSIEALFGMILARFEEDYNRDRPCLVQDSLSFLFAARRGLTEAEVRDLLGAGDDPLPHAYWSPFFLAAEPSLINRDGRLDFFHAYLRSAVASRYLSSRSERDAVHDRLAEYFKARPLDPRKVEELPWQYLRAERWDPLAACLGDPAFLHYGWNRAEFDMRMYWAQLMQHSGHTPQEAFRSTLEAPLESFEALDSIGQLLYSMGASDEALALQTARIEAARVVDSPADRASALHWKARIVGERGDCTQALQIYRALEQLYRDLHDDLSLAGILNSQAVILKRQGDLQGALRLHTEQEHLVRTLGDRRLLAEVLHNQGTILFAQGNYPQALDRFEESERIVLSYDDKATLAETINARAAVYDRLGKLDMALEEFTRAETMQRLLGDRRALKVTLGNRAGILRRMGQGDAALAIHQEQEQISREMEDRETLAAALNGQALVLKLRGDLEAALRLFEEMETISRQVGTLHTLQVALGNRASILHQQGHLEKALAIQEEEIDICRRAGYRDDLARALYTSSDLLYDLKRYEAALPLAQEGYQLARELGLDEMAHDLEMRWFPP